MASFVLTPSVIYEVLNTEQFQIPESQNRGVSLTLRDVESGSTKIARVGFTDVAITMLAKVEPPYQIEDLALRAFAVSMNSRNLSDFRIGSTDLENFYDKSSNARDRHVEVARLIYRYFEVGQGSPILSTHCIYHSTLYRKADIANSIQHLNNLYDLFVTVGNNETVSLKPGGRLRLLRAFIEQEEGKMSFSTANLSAATNRYFQTVPLGRKLDNKPFIFVIMPFKNEELDQTIWTDVMKPALEETFPELLVIRSDSVTEPGKIDNQIFTAIVKAKIVVAEVTKPNANVYYELGLAHSLDKRVYMFCERSAIKQQALAFDIRTGRAEPYDDGVHLTRLIREKVEL